MHQPAYLTSRARKPCCLLGIMHDFLLRYSLHRTNKYGSLHFSKINRTCYSSAKRF